MAVLALLVPAVVGFVWVTALWPGRRGLDRAFPLRVGLGLGWGLGAAAWGYVLWRLAGGGSAVLAVEAVTAAVLLAAGVLLLRRTRGAIELPRGPGGGTGLGTVLGVAFGLAVAARAVQVVVLNAAFPHGHGDAQFIWNLKARFLHRGGDDWRLLFAFDTPGGTKHPLAPPDYPLMVPATVARLWAYAGAESTWEPALLAVVFTVGSLVLMYAAVAAVRGRTQGAVAGLALAATPFFTFLGSAQVADVPLAFFMLAALAPLALRDATGRTDLRWAVLAGVAAGLAGWVKNEGCLFAAVLAVSRVAVVTAGSGWREAAREAAAFLLGAAPFGGLLLYYRLGVIPDANYLLAGQGGPGTAAKLTNPARYVLILVAAVRQLVPGPSHATTIGPILLLAIPYRALLGRAPDRGRHPAATPLLVLALTLLGYGAVYLTTPVDLAVHLTSSLHRLLMHLWPVFLFWFFLGTAGPAEALARDPGGPPATPAGA